MNKSYFVITNSDGDTCVDMITEEKLLKRLDEKYWGEDVKFLNEIPTSDTNYWGETVLIVGGEIVVPKPKEIVVSYNL